MITTLLVFNALIFFMAGSGYNEQLSKPQNTFVSMMSSSFSVLNLYAAYWINFHS